nr:esterase-like activity of phytase family protein [Chelativorans xinjiangense]
MIARPIAEFRIGSSEARFGPLEFIGGLEMTSRNRAFGGLSSFRFLDAGRRFVGVADTGLWFFGALSHDAGGRPEGIDTFTMEPIQDLDGNVSGEKWTTDAEAIAVEGDRVTVGFERDHRIAEFRLMPEAMGAATGEVDFLVPDYELRTNRGFETVAHAPEDSAFAGARVAVTERSIDTRGNVFAAILEGPLKGVFTVARSDNYDITDGAFLPNGDLLLLERRFSMASGIAMRLRRISAASIRPGSVADGPVLLEADMSYQIDNMEALDVWRRGADGALIVSLLSDDNHSILQRNLYLEFRLHGE